MFQTVIKRDSVLRTSSKMFSAHGKYQAAIESAGCKTMVSLLNGTNLDSIASLHYRHLCKKVPTAIPHLSHPSGCPHHSYNLSLKTNLPSIHGVDGP